MSNDSERESFVPAETRPLLSDEAVFRKEDFGGLLFDINTARIYKMGETTFRVLELCDGKTTVSEMAAVLAREFEENGERVQKDVVEFIQGLSLLRLVRL